MSEEFAPYRRSVIVQIDLDIRYARSGAFEELLDDVTGKLFGAYGDDTVVYPGHGDDTTLGAGVRTWPSGVSAAGQRRTLLTAKRPGTYLLPPCARR